MIRSNGQIHTIKLIRYLIKPNLGDTIENTAVALEIVILNNAGYHIYEDRNFAEDQNEKLSLLDYDSKFKVKSWPQSIKEMKRIIM